MKTKKLTLWLNMSEDDVTRVDGLIEDFLDAYCTGVGASSFEALVSHNWVAHDGFGNLIAKAGIQ